MFSPTASRLFLPQTYRCKHAIQHGLGALRSFVIAGLMLLALLAASAMAQPTGQQAPSHQETSSKSTATTAEQPPAVNELLRLLADPQVQEWLKKTQLPPPSTQPTVAAPSTAPAATDETSGLAIMLNERLARTRAHIHNVIEEVPNLPDEIAHAGERLQQDAQSVDTNGMLLRILLSVGLGVLFRLAFVRYAKLHGADEAHLHVTPGKRLQYFCIQLGFAIAPSLAFAIGALIPFIAVEWSPLIKHAMLNFLLALIAIQLANDLSHAILVRATDHKRPSYNRQLRHFWYRRIVLFLGYFVWSWAAIGVLVAAQVSHHSVQAIAYILGLVQLGIALEIIWRRPLAPDVADNTTRHRFTYNILLSAYGVLLWLFWAANLSGLFWLGVFALLLPTLILANGSFVREVIRPSEGIHSESVSLLEIGLERGVRVLIVVAAVLWLAHIWQIDLIELTSRDTTLTRLARGILNAAVVLLVADFIWQIARTIIDMRLAAAQKNLDEAHPAAPPSSEAPAHNGHGIDYVKQARLRTLLPIFRNILLVAIILIAGLTALSELGIEIAPLIAGAGVVGVAVGFGSQTIVKDVISGIFYLLDDAFRVGEYIQSGNYKGTVKSFSLRSVKLRHQRGPIFTVPFGQLGAVQNMSRDWVLDKFQIGVAYDTDLDQARKIIKNIGTELAADPELGPHILEPLKMQGVQEFGQYGIEIRCKIMTRPGEQFVVRRTAFKRIKQEFDKAGIKFALPRVQVAGGVEPGAAAMQVHRAIEEAREANRE